MNGFQSNYHKLRDMDVKAKGTEEKEDQQNGFYCQVCDCIVKDSLNYLDHVNGKRHNRNLGISLKKFTDSTLEQVKEMLEKKKRERDEKISGFVYEPVDEEKLRRRKREKKKRQKAKRAGRIYLAEDKQEEENEDDDDDDEDDYSNEDVDVGCDDDCQN